MALTDAFTRLCGTGQAITTLDVVSSAWFDAGALQERVLGAGQLVVARFGCTVSATCAADPDATVAFHIVHTPKELATPTTARTFTFDSTSAVDDATETITATAHGLVNGTRVTSSGTPPTGFTTATWFYVINATTNTFQISATPGGSAVNLTDAVGTCTVTWYPEIVASTGPVPFDRLIANAWVHEIALSPFWRATATRPPVPYGRYIYAYFTGPTTLDTGTFTCDMVSGFATDGMPQQKVGYVTM